MAKGQTAHAFGSALRALRRDLRMTQLQMAHTIGYNRDNWIGAMERAERNLEFSTVDNVCDGLDVDIEIRLIPRRRGRLRAAESGEDPGARDR